MFVPRRSLALDQLVPADDFYRHLEAQLDLRFVRPWVEGLYAKHGRPSIDPVVFFKLQLILFFEGLRSERQLLRVVADRLSLRWYVGYDLGDELPHHSSLTRIRARYGRPFFERVVDLCQEAGLVWGKELIFDATRVEANAALDGLVPRFYLKAKAASAEIAEHLEVLFRPEPTDETIPTAAAPPAETVREQPEPLLAPTPIPTGLSDAELAQLAAANASQWRLLEEGQLDPERPPAGGYQRIAGLRVNPTDPDATPMELKKGGARLGYQDHYVVDGGKQRIILAALVLPADIRESVPLADLTRRVCFRWHLRPARAIADSAYGTGENLRIREEELNIRALMPVVDAEKPGPFYKQQAFRYDAERDLYVCPQGTELRPSGGNPEKRVWTYQAPAVACQACPVREHCTASTQGRALRRHFDEEYRARVRAYQGTPAYEKAMRKRAVWVEPLFGEAKDWHGLRRFRLRGLANVNIEGLCIAAGQNLKRYLAAKGWGRRPTPSGGRLAPLPLPTLWLMAAPGFQPLPPFFNSLIFVVSPGHIAYRWGCGTTHFYLTQYCNTVIL
jgi:transposase